MEIVKVNASKRYDIVISNGTFNDIGSRIADTVKCRRAAVVTDDNVDKEYGDIVTASMTAAGINTVKFVFPHGESSKCHDTLLKLYDFLAENGFTRSDMLVALGGGVTGDLTGFAAATYMRGIEFIQIPTSLLAMVDSSVGGKTAVNINSGKNLVGAFYQPHLVIADTKMLDTLPDIFFCDGMAEVIKYGMIKSPKVFEMCENMKQENSDVAIGDIVKECVSIKAQVVENDEREAGERMLLNFGHTLGHAIEKYHNFSGITHGAAVAIGMSVFTHRAEEKSMCEKGVAEKLDALLKAHGLPTETEAPMDVLFKYSLGDKKRNSNGLDIVICSDIGKSSIVRMSVEEYAEFLGV